MSSNSHQLQPQHGFPRHSSQRGGYQITPGTSLPAQDSPEGRPQNPDTQRDTDGQQYSYGYQDNAAISVGGRQRSMSAYRRQRLSDADNSRNALPVYNSTPAATTASFDAPAAYMPQQLPDYPSRQPTYDETPQYDQNNRYSWMSGYSAQQATNHGSPQAHEPYQTYGQSIREPDVYQSSANEHPQPNFTSDRQSYSSATAIAAAAATPAIASHDYPSQMDLAETLPHTPARSSDMLLGTQYPGYTPSRADARNAQFGAIDPNDIEDDDEDPFQLPKQRGKKTSGVPLSAAAVGAGASAAAIGAGKFIKAFGSRENSRAYGSVPGGVQEKGEKSEWLDQQTRSHKRTKWMVAGLICLVIVLAIIGGVVGAVLSSKKSSSSTSSSSGNGLTAESPSIKALMNNPNLHKVFPGVDYTPLNAQYPACLTTPPSQDNVTMDIAVLSQLSPTVRLYGTDCNQTEMVLDAISALGLNNSMKVWLGVWLENNQTTNARQMDQMYSVLSQYPSSQFAGVIIGNEVLFRKDLTEQELIEILAGAQSKLKSENIDLPIATSDIGSSWTSSLVEAVDVVMSNVHPFFGGVPAPQAASWTWSYWQNNDVDLTRGMTGKQSIIAETGWPSGGGNDCGVGGSCTSSTAGAVAGIDEMNTYMSSWVCDALTNSTQYFWFEAFDEPWQAIYNTPTESWETQWGLMDANRNLKKGVNIPNCGGKTASLGS